MKHSASFIFLVLFFLTLLVLLMFNDDFWSLTRNSRQVYDSGDEPEHDRDYSKNKNRQTTSSPTTPSTPPTTAAPFITTSDTPETPTRRNRSWTTAAPITTTSDTPETPEPSSRNRSWTTAAPINNTSDMPDTPEPSTTTGAPRWQFEPRSRDSGDREKNTGMAASAPPPR